MQLIFFPLITYFFFSSISIYYIWCNPSVRPYAFIFMLSFLHLSLSSPSVHPTVRLRLYVVFLPLSLSSPSVRPTVCLRLYVVTFASELLQSVRPSDRLSTSLCRLLCFWAWVVRLSIRPSVYVFMSSPLLLSFCSPSVRPSDRLSTSLCRLFYIWAWVVRLSIRPSVRPSVYVFLSSSCPWSLSSSRSMSGTILLGSRLSSYLRTGFPSPSTKNFSKFHLISLPWKGS